MTKEQEINQLETMLSYLIKPNMTLDEKIKSLSKSYWRSHNSGYGDAIANKQMSGINDGQTEQYDLDCKYQYEVNRLIELLEESKKEGC